MSEGNNNSLVNLGDLTKPASLLIEKISGAIGVWWEPHQIVRKADAEAKAEKIKALSRMEITDIEQRGLQRLVYEEGKKQENVESVVLLALPKLNEDAQPQQIDNDWIVNFLEKAKLFSSGEMKELWARILAGESSKLGSFSRKTINLLEDVEQVDAELFTCLLGFCCKLDGDFVPLFFDYKHEFHKKFGLNFDSLSHLEDLGLISFVAGIGDYEQTDLSKNISAEYFGKKVELVMPNEKGNRLLFGKVMLTKAGKELASICDAQPVDGFFEFVCEQWSAYISSNNVVVGV